MSRKGVVLVMGEQRTPDTIAEAAAGAESRLDEIRQLEERLISLKREMITELARAAEELDDTEDAEKTFLVLRGGNAEVALPIASVEGVVQLPSIDQIAGAEVASSIRGVVDYHGAMLAVVDLALLLGQEQIELRRDRILAICDVPPRRLAILADEALDTVAAGDGDVVVAEEVLPGGVRAVGMLKREGGTTAIVDPRWVALGIEASALMAEGQPARVAEPIDEG